MTVYAIRLALSGLLLMLLAGCQPFRLQAQPDLPGLNITRVTGLSGCTGGSWSPDGARFAASCPDSVRVIAVERQEPALTLPGYRVAAYGDKFLALLADRGTETELVVTNVSGTSILDRFWLHGPVASAVWNDQGALFLLVCEVKHFRFGSNLKYSIERYQDGRLNRLAKVHDVTIKPGTWERSGASILQKSRLKISSFNDLLLFTAFQEPPALSGYYAVYGYHPQTEKVWRIWSGQDSFGDFSLLPDNDTLLIGDGRGTTAVVNLWGGSQISLLQEPGQSVRTSPGGDHRVVDEHWSVDGQPFQTLPEGAQLEFSPVGDRALLRDRANNWLLLSGFPADPAPRPTEKAMQTLRKLRRWRSLDLISTEEYQQLREGLR